ncbi:MAG: NBR1-Ig-like domain-containing protein [Anaerolineales bacterium]
MKKLGVVALILVGASTIVLLVMLVFKAVQNQKKIEQFQLTQTAGVATQSAALTLTAVPTETPLPTFTFTPEPTVTATLEPINIVIPTETKPAVLVEGCDVAAFITDVTVPDGQEFDHDTKFVKTWQILNDGSCTWNSFYKIYFVSGDKMSGPNNQQLTAIDVPPGASIDVSIEMRAPKEPGTYRGYWGLKNTNGLEFGVGPAGVPFYVEIKVVGP